MGHRVLRKVQQLSERTNSRAQQHHNIRIIDIIDSGTTDWIPDTCAAETSDQLVRNDILMKNNLGELSPSYLTLHYNLYNTYAPVTKVIYIFQMISIK